MSKYWYIAGYDSKFRTLSEVRSHIYFAYTLAEKAQHDGVFVYYYDEKRSEVLSTYMISYVKKYPYFKLKRI